MDQLDLTHALDTHLHINDTSKLDFNDIALKAKELHQRGQTNEAKRTYRYILSQQPSYEHFCGFMEILFDDQEWLECLKVIDLALSHRGSQLKGLHDLYRVQGCCYTQIGNWERAEDSFYCALEHPGAVDVVLVNLGTLDIQRKQWESSTQSFREAVRLNSNNDKGWVGLALCHRFKGDHQLALANLEKALDINVRNETAIGLLLAWYSDQNPDVLFHRLRNYILDEGSEPQLWLAFVESAKRTGHYQIANLELERLRLTHTHFIPAFQYRF